MNTYILGHGSPIQEISNGITIENLGLENLYYKTSRYDLFNEVINYIKLNTDVKIILDIATSFGTFVYLANKNDLICEGCDIEVLENANDIFIKEFDKPCIFQLEINNILSLDKNYDMICSFNLTHIFSYESFIYLLQLLSVKSKYVFYILTQTM